MQIASGWVLAVSLAVALALCLHRPAAAHCPLCGGGGGGGSAGAGAARSGLSGVGGGGEGRLFSLDYLLVTDDTGTRDDHLQHRLGVRLEKAFGPFFTAGGRVWLEWHDGPRAIGETGNGELRRADYSFYLRTPVKPLSATLETGWTARTFPQFSGDPQFTHEWYVGLTFDDSKLFGAKQPVLNPSITYYRDLDDFKGGWLDLGVRHYFVLKDMGFDKHRILKDVQLTPSLVMGIDQGQLGGDWRIGSLRYGVDLKYDLSNALKIPEKHGRLCLTTFIYYTDSFVPELKDRLFGGVGMNYSW